MEQSTQQAIDYRRQRYVSCPIRFKMALPEDVDLDPFTGMDWEPLPEQWKAWQS
jgi:hypothetical protein